MLCAIGYSQAKKVSIYGFVKESGKGLDRTKVTIQRGGENLWSTETNNKGRFDFSLDYDKVYTIEFARFRYAPKRIEIDTRNVPPNEQRFGHEWGGWQVTLFKNLPGVNVDVLDQLVAKAIYEPEEMNFGFDYNYFRKIGPEMEALNKEVKTAEKEFKKVEAQRLADFKKLVKEADKLYREETWKESLAKYEEAKALKEEDEYVGWQIEDVTQKIEEEERYQNFLAQAKEREQDGKLEDALVSLRSAAALKPESEIPPQEVERIQKLLDEQNELAMAEAKAKMDAERAEAEAEEKARKEEETRQKEEAARKAEEERAKKEAERKALEEKRRQEEETRRAEVEAEQKRIKEARQKVIEEHRAELEAMDKKSEEFIQELAKVYPAGVTEEFLELKNRVIFKRIVVIGNRGTLYERVRYNYGGEFFFKNGSSISKFIWDKETVLRESDGAVKLD